MRPMPAAERALKAAALKTGVLPVGLRRWLTGYGLEIAALTAGALAWEAVGWMLGLQWLPPFSQVVVAFVHFVQSGVIVSNLQSSLTGLLVGFALSVILGLSLGALMGRYRAVERALDIYVHALFVCPSILFAPIFLAT